MGSIVGSCAGSLLSGLLCGLCGMKTPKKGWPAKVPYLTLLILSGIFAAIMKFYGEKKWSLVKNIPESTSPSVTFPPGNSSVFRISAVMCIFEAIHVAVLMIPKMYSFHYRLFGLKVILYIGGIVLVFFFAEQKFSDGFADASRFFLSPVYLLLQILLLITFIHNLNDWLLQSRNNLWYWFIFATSVTLYVISYVFLGLFFKWHSKGSCARNDGIIATGMVLVFLNLVFSVLSGGKSAPFKYILPSSLLSAYVTWLFFNALNATSNGECNVFKKDKGPPNLWIGVILSLVGLAYSVVRSDLYSLFVSPVDQQSSSDHRSMDDRDHSSSMEMDKMDKNNRDSNYDDIADDGNDDDDEQSSKKRKMKKDKRKKRRRNSSDNDDSDDDESSDESVQIGNHEKRDAVCFHIIMCFASGYLAMLLTNWGSIKEDGRNNASLIANVVTAGVCEVLFIWTMIAPLVFPHRFAHMEDEQSS